MTFRVSHNHTTTSLNIIIHTGVQGFLAAQFRALQAKLDEAEQRDAGELGQRIQEGESHASRMSRLLKPVFFGGFFPIYNII